MKKGKGLHEYRFKQNPEERAFAEAWRYQEQCCTLAYLMGDGTRKAVVSDRDETVAATLIQWLGSPVGQAFLAELGYAKLATK